MNQMRSLGKCVMPAEGVFSVGTAEGTIRKGKPIEILRERET